MSSSEKLYTQEQLDIALLKQKNEEIFIVLNEIKNDSNSNLHWIIGSISILYVPLIAMLVTFLSNIFDLF